MATLKSQQEQIAYLTEENATLRKRVVELEQKIEDSKLISRAKAVLMKKYRLDEQRAHRYLQKTAMDTRITLALLARQILEGTALYSGKIYCS